MKLSVPHIDKSDIRSINTVLKSEWISTSSKIVNKFENRLSNYCGIKYSVALNSGTSAIHLGLKILGVNKTSEVIVPSLTFIATAFAVLYVGAVPIFADINPTLQKILSELIAAKEVKLLLSQENVLFSDPALVLTDDVTSLLDVALAEGQNE